MATTTMATAAGVAMLLYFVLSRPISIRESEIDGGDLSKGRRSGRWRISRRPEHASATWREAAATLAETLRFTYLETLGKWPIGDLAFGIKYLMRRQKPFPLFLESAGFSEDVLIQEPKAGLLRPAFTIVRDKSSKSFLLLIRGTHSIKDTLTVATGAIVPFHHLVLHEGGISNFVLGYAHCGMVAAARWIAKCTTSCLLKAVNQHPDYSIKIIGHSLGGGTAALLTYILRERKEFSSSTCIAFAPAACMTWDLAESGKHFITTIINCSDLVPSFSTASFDNLCSEVTASSWLNDLRDQIQNTRFLNVVYQSASALGSHLPSISSAKARVAGAGALLRPVSTSTQVVMKCAQNVAEAVGWSRSSFSLWSCMGARRHVGSIPSSEQIKEVNGVTSSDEVNYGCSPLEHEETEEDELIHADKASNVSTVEDMTDGELWFELEKEFHRHDENIKARTEEEAAIAKEITKERGDRGDKGSCQK